jgi:hypothetical protein
MLCRHQLQQKRTVKKLAAFVPRVIRQVSTKPSERHKAHLKKGLYKEFIDEVIPLSQFCSLRYPKGYIVEYSCDNRPYDASVQDPHGKSCERIELAFPHLGNVQAKMNQRVVKNGFGSSDWESPGESIEKLRQPFRDSALKKSQKQYPNAILVFVAEYLKPFRVHHGITVARRDDLVRILKGFKFHAKEVYLLDVPCGIIVKVQP